MIEIEKNFDLKPGDKKRIIKDAEFIGRRQFTDIYYDTQDYKLTTNDFWLRQRDGKWELKTPAVKRTSIKDTTIDRYHELENDRDIAKELKISFKITLNKALREKTIVPFATITTKRETYQKNEFHLDFDEMDFGYVDFEIELMITNEKEIAEADRKINRFAKRYQLTGNKRGKVIEYLFRKNPKHYRALVKARIL